MIRRNDKRKEFDEDPVELDEEFDDSKEIEAFDKEPENDDEDYEEYEIQGLVSKGSYPLVVRKSEGRNPLINRYDIDFEWLKEHYKEKRFSASKIARILGVTTPTVTKILLEHGLSRYTPDRFAQLENEVYRVVMEHPLYMAEDIAKKLNVSVNEVRLAYKRMRENGKMNRLNAELEKLKKK